MKNIHKSVLIWYSPEEMFRLVERATVDGLLRGGEGAGLAAECLDGQRGQPGCEIRVDGPAAVGPGGGAEKPEASSSVVGCQRSMTCG